MSPKSEPFTTIRCCRPGSTPRNTTTGRPVHGGQAADELRDGQFELADQHMADQHMADQHTARSRDGKAGGIRAGGQRQREVSDQQRFAQLRLSADEQIPCGGNGPGSIGQSGAVGGCCSSSWASDRTLGSPSFWRVVALIAAPPWWHPAESRGKKSGLVCLRVRAPAFGKAWRRWWRTAANSDTWLPPAFQDNKHARVQSITGRIRRRSSGVSTSNHSGPSS